jgi:Membrane protein implicated in regulation of membrane protease activity
MDLSIMWLVVLILFILVEIFTFDLISIWFILGSVVSLILSLFVDNFIIQVLVFSLVSLITLILSRPFVKKYMDNKRENTNFDVVVGKIAIVTKEPTKTTKGQAKVEGKLWTIISDDEIEIDDKVEVLKIEGVKLKVRKVEK